MLGFSLSPLLNTNLMFSIIVQCARQLVLSLYIYFIFFLFLFLPLLLRNHTSALISAIARFSVYPVRRSLLPAIKTVQMYKNLITAQSHHNKCYIAASNTRYYHTKNASRRRCLFISTQKGKWPRRCEKTMVFCGKIKEKQNSFLDSSIAVLIDFQLSNRVRASIVLLSKC